MDGEADLIIHHVDKSDPRLEFIDLFAIALIPVVAPNFFVVSNLGLRDAASECGIASNASFAIRRGTLHRGTILFLEGARSWTVSDQLMKKEVIRAGDGLGHLPVFLISAELARFEGAIASDLTYPTELAV